MSHIFFRALFLALSFGFAGILFSSAPVHAATTTVCASGCDFTSLNAAVSAPPAPGDSIVLQTGYTYDEIAEGGSINLPDGLTLACDSGVTYGDSLQAPNYLYPGSSTILYGCTFENTNFDASGKSDVRFLENIFSSAAASQLVFTLSSGITIRDNQGIQKVQFQNADNAVIENNVFECRHGVNCLTLATAGGGPFDYSNPADVSDNVDIINNTFHNYNVSGSDYVHLFAGIDINFSGNLIDSAVVVDDAFVTVVTISNGQVNFANNVIVFPEKDPGDTNGTWGLNIRVDEGDVDLTAEHNTFIMGGAATALGGSACFGVFDAGSAAGLQQLNLDFQYSICYNPFPNNGGTGINLNYNTASSTVTLHDAYNGFTRLSTLINDSNGVLTSVDATSIVGDPAFRLADVDPLNDYELSPFSDFLDINGTLDIGAIPGVRGNSFVIDASGVVDYVSVDATTTAVLFSNLRSNDSVSMAAGIYAPATVSGTVRLVSGLSLVGAGNSTVFQVPSNTNGSAFTVRGLNDSSFSYLVFQSGSSTPVLSTYSATRALLVYSGNTYDDSFAVTGIANAALLIQDMSCNIDFIDADGKDVTALIGSAVDDWNVGLVDVFGNKLTIYAPNNFVTSSAALVSYLGLICGAPVTIDQFVPSIFSVSGGDYSYNSSAASIAGVTVQPSDTNPPRIDRTVAVIEHGGISLDNANGNTFTHVTSTSNSNGVMFRGTSQGNGFVESTLTGNVDADIWSNSSGQNQLYDTLFSRAISNVMGSGSVRAYFSARAFVQDPDLNPLEGISVTFLSANSATATTMLTNASGTTALSVFLPAYDLTSSSLTETSGGFNSYSVSGGATGTFGLTAVSGNLNSREQLYSITMGLAPTSGDSTPSNGGGGGGGPVLPARGFATPFSSIDPALVQRMNELGFKPHELVKLPDDRNPKTQIDSTVYYLGIDGRRHAFPNASVYFSWYCDFKEIRTISSADLAKMPLGRNVTYRPGLRLVKFPSVPTVYLAQIGGVLKPIANEAVAYGLLGPAWNKSVVDISEAFFGDYVIDGAITTLMEGVIRSYDQTTATISGSMNFSGYEEDQLTGVQLCKL